MARWPCSWIAQQCKTHVHSVFSDDDRRGTHDVSLEQRCYLFFHCPVFNQHQPKDLWTSDYNRLSRSLYMMNTEKVPQLAWQMPCMLERLFDCVLGLSCVSAKYTVDIFWLDLPAPNFRVLALVPTRGMRRVGRMAKYLRRIAWWNEIWSMVHTYSVNLKVIFAAMNFRLTCQTCQSWQPWSQRIGLTNGRSTWQIRSFLGKFFCTRPFPRTKVVVRDGGWSGRHKGDPVQEACNDGLTKWATQAKTKKHRGFKKNMNRCVYIYIYII